MKSVMNHQFSQVPSIEIPRSVFNRSHGYKTTFNEDYLIPFYVDEALPGDTFNLRATIFARLATPVVPIMDNLYLDTFYFAVPNRLLWEHWVNFMGEVADPNTVSVDYVIPDMGNSHTITPTEESLADYFGLPISTPCNGVSALPFRAYNMIYNTWFRDQNLITPLHEEKGDGPDNTEWYSLQKRGKRHDYFTSATKWPQKGPGVQIPLAGEAQVKGNGGAMLFSDSHQNLRLSMNDTINPVMGVGNAISMGSAVSEVAPSNYHLAIGLDTDGSKTGIIADLGTATAATINSLRQAFQLQRLYERDARSGTRYIEMIRAHFGVVSPDFRMQRPEYLGGSSKPININPVVQNSATAAGVSPQGNLAAFGLVSDSSGGFHHSFVEHCTIIGLLNVRADLTYQRGINRMWTRKYREDFYLPVLAHLGEQEIKVKEIYATGDPDKDEAIWGYQERFAEYRYYPSQITGYLNSGAGDTLDKWHLSQHFTAQPTLGKTFIESNTPIERVVAVENQPHFIMDSFIELKCARPMPVYSVPGLIDHF